MSVMPSNHLILLCRPLLLLPSIFPSIRVFSNESALHIRRPRYWNFSFTFNEYSGLISFRMDWFDVLAVQRTLKSLLQHQNSKALILWCSVFFMVQFSYPYMTIYSNLFELNCVKIISRWMRFKLIYLIKECEKRTNIMFIKPVEISKIKSSIWRKGGF